MHTERQFPDSRIYDSKLLSVVIPAYNAEAFLGTAIRSVLDQSQGEIEIIVVNDGSTDATAEVALQFGSQIRYLEQANSGVSQARNAGLRVAKGQWIAWLDADDFWLSEYWKVVKALLSLNQQCDVWCFGWVYAKEDGTIVGKPIQPAEGAIELREIVLANRILSHSAVVRRIAFNRIGWFDPSLAYAEDWDVWMRLALSGAQFQRISTPLVAYREKSNSLSKDLARARVDGLRVIDKAFKDPNLPEDLCIEADEVRGRFLAQMAAFELAASNNETAFADLHQACRLVPSLLLEEQTYYALASSCQPPHDWGNAQGIDLNSQRRLLNTLLGRLLSELDLPSETQQLARATMNRVFLKLAHQQHNRLHMMRYWAGLLAARPMELARRETWRWLPRIAWGQPRFPVVSFGE